MFGALVSTAATVAAVATVSAVSYLWSQDQGALLLAQTAASTASTTITACDAGHPQEPPTPKEKAARLFRKRTTIQVANTNENNNSRNRNASPASNKSVLQRMSTQQELDKLRSKEKEMMQRWERDEEGWRELPARAWPAYQPNPEQLQGILAEITIHDCQKLILEKKSQGDECGDTSSPTNIDLSDYPNVPSERLQICTQLLFDMATTLVFYGVDPAAGLAQYDQLAEQGHVDSMVACGIIMMEGLGVPPREQEGLEWLQKAVERGSAQAFYELGTVYYTGIDGVVDEDVEKAFELFERAAEQDHTAAIYMVADCLVEGEGVEKSVARAIPLFYKAAERGHRFSRQRIRELLARIDYPL
ncbi:MAG: hypothetical protein SGILL_002140 [Bacillariaceae sp.]